MPTLVIRNPDGTETTHELSEQLTIGRSDGHDIVLTEGGVSRNHARFFVEGDGVSVEDLGSSNGTWVDGQKIEGPTPVPEGAQVVLGDYEVQVRAGAKRKPPTRSGARVPAVKPPAKGATAAPRSTRVVAAIKPSGAGAGLARRARPAGSASGPQLRGLTGGVTGKTFPLSGTKVVGRVGAVDILIDDDSVSRKHAELEVRGREVILRDLKSANGTTVNGAPISEDTPLSQGDIVQFGVVEVQFETTASSGGRAAVSSGRRPAVSSGGLDRPARRRPAPSRDDDDFGGGSEQPPGGPGMDPRKKRLVFLGGGVVGLLFLMVLAKAFLTPPPPVPDARPLKSPGGKPAVGTTSDDPAEQIDELLTQCRTYANAEVGEPKWDRAEEACKKVLELEPIQADAAKLLKEITTGKACEQNLKRAGELGALNRNEEAVDAYAKIRPDCPSYFLRALVASKEAVEDVKKRAGADCKLYASNGKWENALSRCEVYSRLACQTMPPEEIFPPAGMTARLDGAVGKFDWRPKDPLYVNFLKARAHLKPNDPPWVCPDFPVFRPAPKPADPANAAREEFAKRYPDPAMGQALVLYFDGKFIESKVPLQKLLERVDKSQYHDAARALLLDVSNAVNLLQSGRTELTNEKVEKAQDPFRQALDIDERLMLGGKKLSDADKVKELARRTSYLRHTLVEEMSSKCYSKGKEYADKKDFRKACSLWKLGTSFSRSNIDLLKAVTNVCTKKAADALARADSCEAYRSVLDFAVDGDGMKEDAQKKMDELGCSGQ
jgi:pSer/pThr/pTyr-binding forkhead associated (FHA) protein